MHKVYRHELDSPETSIDTTDKLVDSCAQILILLYVLSGGNCKLRKDDLPDPLRVLCKEEFECVKLLGNALDVVEAVNTDNNLDSVEAML